MNLSEAWKAYVLDKKLFGYSEHTLKQYDLQLKLLIRFFGDVDISSITYSQLKEYLVSQTHLKPSSISHRMKFIRSLYHWAQNEGHVSLNPSSKLKEPKMGERIPKAISEEDIEMLRVNCKTTLEHALVEFFYTSGCRIGEVFKINKHELDFISRSVIVLGKGNKEREVYFSTRAVIWIKKYLSERKDDDEALFVTQRKPIRRLSIGQMRVIMKGVAKRANVESNVNPHRFRHSYATHLLDKGAPLEVIQSPLGHARIDTTRIYAHLSGLKRNEIYRKYF